MERMGRICVCLTAAFVMVALLGCRQKEECEDEVCFVSTDEDVDTASDGDTDGDIDMDTDTDTYTDADTGSDSDAATDTVTDADTQPSADVDFITIHGGTFDMGASDGESDELPVHSVTVPTFEMTKTEVTVFQYKDCVDSGACTEELEGVGSCNWEVSGYEGHPINCVDWQQAVDFCEWIGGRLPSEAEWEYAASNGSAENIYPWKDETATCDYAVMHEGGAGCGEGSTWPVCSKTTGNTSLGLCDMAGNVWEWVQDWYHENYTDAPTDGSAWEDSGDYRVMRGGSWRDVDTEYLRASGRSVLLSSSGRSEYIGFRCARSPL